MTTRPDSGPPSPRGAGGPWQRCQLHLQQNALAFVPNSHRREQVAADLRTLRQASDLPEAQCRLKTLTAKDKDAAPHLADGLEANGPDRLTVLALPAAQRKKRRPTNSLERRNPESQRRPRVAPRCPHEQSRERLVTARLSEVSDEWETGTMYLNRKH